MKIPIVNEILKLINEKGIVNFERILWVDNSIIVTIDIQSNKALPEIKDHDFILEEIEKKMIQITVDDPFSIAILEESINSKSKTIRDKSWKIIENAVSNEPEIYFREKRGSIINEIKNEHGIQKKYIYKYLRRYWQRGKNKNALLPDYWKSGGKGKDKVLGEKKIGRPRKTQNLNIHGTNVDEAAKRNFRVAISNFYNTPKKNSLVDAYHMMVKKFYTDGFVMENGIKKALLYPIKEIPSFTQFKYWFQKEQNIKKILSSRLGAKKY